MKKFLWVFVLILCCAAAGFGQVRGSGLRGTGGGSVSSMMAVYADSSLLTIGSHVHQIKPRGGRSLWVDSLTVDSYALFNGKVVINTSTTENVIIGATTTPKSTVEVVGTGISAVNYQKGLRLSNPDAATVGVQALSPALTFRGAGWKTDATAGSDSVLAAIFVTPVQGTSAPASRLYFSTKTGAGAWSTSTYLQSNGTFFVPQVNANSFYAASFMNDPGDVNYGAEDNVYLSMDSNNNDTDTRFIDFGKNGVGSAHTSVARLTETGNLGLGTTTPFAHHSIVDASSGQGTGFHLTSSQWNKARTTWATAHDTSSIAVYIDSAGGPRLSFKSVKGDTAGITMDANYLAFNSNLGYSFTRGTTTAFYISSGSVQSISLQPVVTATSDLGSASIKWRDIYNSRATYIGGKGQTPSLTIGQQNTMTEQTDSTQVHDISTGNARSRWYAGDGDLFSITSAGDSARVASTNALALNVPSVKFGNSNAAVSKIDTVFTAGYVPRWVKFTSGGKTWMSPVYAAADTTGKW